MPKLQNFNGRYCEWEFENAFITYLGSAEKALRQQKPQYIKYPLSFIHKIWYNTHIADDPKTGTFYKKTANLRGVEVCTSTKTVHK